MSYMTHSYLGKKDKVHVSSIQTVQVGDICAVWGVCKCLRMFHVHARDCVKSSSSNNFFRMPLSIYQSLGHVATRTVEYPFDRYTDTQIEELLTTPLD